MDSGEIAYANLNQDLMTFKSSFDFGPLTFTKRNDIVLQKPLVTGPFVISIREDGVNACVLTTEGKIEVWQPEQFSLRLAEKDLQLAELPIEPIDIQYSKNSQSIILIFKEDKKSNVLFIDEINKNRIANLMVNDPIQADQTANYWLFLTNNGKLHRFDKSRDTSNPAFLLR